MEGVITTLDCRGVAKIYIDFPDLSVCNLLAQRITNDHCQSCHESCEKNGSVSVRDHGKRVVMIMISEHDIVAGPGSRQILRFRTISRLRLMG